MLLPGITFRRFYYAEEFSHQYFRENLFLVFTATIVPSLFFQLLGYWVASWGAPAADLVVIGQLVAGGDQTISALGNVATHLQWIVAHQFFLCLLAGFIGWLGRKIIRACKWDRKYKLFRYQNSWHYLLKGEFFDFPKEEIDLDLREDRVEDIEVIFVSAIQDMAAGTYLYDGILVDYELDRDGGLKTISLKATKRRNIMKDAPDGVPDPDDRYYPVRGHLLILKYAELKNLNLTYYKLVAITEDQQLRIPRQVQ